MQVRVAKGVSWVVLLYESIDWFFEINNAFVLLCMRRCAGAVDLRSYVINLAQSSYTPSARCVPLVLHFVQQGCFYEKSRLSRVLDRQLPAVVPLAGGSERKSERTGGMPAPYPANMNARLSSCDGTMAAPGAGPGAVP